jgi:argininosuccinate lyase
VVAGLDFDRKAMRAAAGHEEMMAAGLAVALARDGLPFRKAHGVVAGLVAEARKTGTSLRETARRVLAKDHPRLAADVDALFDPERAIRTRSLPGGTAPDAVRVSLRQAVERVG